MKEDAVPPAEPRKFDDSLSTVKCGNLQLMMQLYSIFISQNNRFLIPLINYLLPILVEHGAVCSHLQICLTIYTISRVQQPPSSSSVRHFDLVTWHHTHRLNISWTGHAGTAQFWFRARGATSCWQSWVVRSIHFFSAWLRLIESMINSICCFDMIESVMEMDHPKKIDGYI